MAGDEKTISEMQQRLERIYALRSTLGSDVREYHRLMNAPWNQDLLVEAAFNYLRQIADARERNNALIAKLEEPLAATRALTRLLAVPNVAAVLDAADALRSLEAALKGDAERLRENREK